MEDGMGNIIFSSWGKRVIDNRKKGDSDPGEITDTELPEYFIENQEIKALMGWNGIIIRSKDVDIVDLCREYLEAVLSHSKTCDRCNYCKTGWQEMIEVLQDVAKGEATEEDLEFVKNAAEAIVGNAKCSIGKIGPNPFLEALKYFNDDITKTAKGEKTVTPGTYHSTLTAPCIDACPIHLDIPKYIELIKDTKFGESLKIIRQKLPLPATVGRVCFRPCESHCRRGLVDEPISIKALKRFVSDFEMSQGKEPAYGITPSPITGKVAVVGAGPAGITCAFHLASKGHAVTVFEKLEEPGGMSAVGIPDYRLPRNILQKEVDELKKMGVTFQYNRTIGKEIKLSQLEADFDAVFIGIGAQESLPLGIDGEKEGGLGFFPGLVYLKSINEGRDPFPEGKKVIVIGGGNVAIDCIRSALRMHKGSVHLIYRRTRAEMPADDAEIRDAEAEQVLFSFLTAPVKLLAQNGKVTGIECIRMKLGEPDQSGRPRPIPVEGSEFVFECDTVISAIGQQIDLSFLEGTADVKTTSWNTVVVDEYTKQSSRSKLFFAGDCETGPDALITACAGGRKAAHSIDRMINRLSLQREPEYYFDRLFKSIPVYDPKEEIRKVEPRKRLHPQSLPPETRKTNFDEVEKGFSAKEAVAEAERCLRCYQVVTVAI
jgi:formate dehydrogenase beta subunit